MYDSRDFQDAESVRSGHSNVTSQLVQSNVDAHSDPDNVSWAGARFYTGSRRAGDALAPSLRRHVARQTKDFRETETAQRRFRGRVWLNAGAGGDGAGAGGKVRPLERMVLDVVKLTRAAVEAGEKKEGWWRERPATGEMMSLLAAALEYLPRRCAGLMDSGGLGVALPCASAKRSRFLPGIFF